MKNGILGMKGIQKMKQVNDVLFLLKQKGKLEQAVGLYCFATIMHRAAMNSSDNSPQDEWGVQAWWNLSVCYRFNLAEMISKKEVVELDDWLREGPGLVPPCFELPKILKAPGIDGYPYCDKFIGSYRVKQFEKDSTALHVVGPIKDNTPEAIRAWNEWVSREFNNKGEVDEY